MTRYRKTSEFHGATFEKIPDKKPSGSSTDNIFEIIAIISLIIIVLFVIYYLVIGVWLVIKWTTIIITAPWWFPIIQGLHNLDIIHKAGHNIFAETSLIIVFIIGLIVAMIAIFITNETLKEKKKKKITIYPLNIAILSLSFCWTFLILSYLPLLIFHIIY